MRTCSHASFEALLDDGRTIMMVGLGDTAATLDIYTFAWTRDEVPGKEEGPESAPPDTREQSDPKRSGERPVLRLPSFRRSMPLFRLSKVLRLLGREKLELSSDHP